jgi:hypothetical protein
MHNNYFFGPYALVAKVIGVTFPKLTIVDAAWTSASGPNNLSDTVHTKILLGSTDPCAVSWYSAKYILTPIAIDPNNTDPDLQGSNYKNNLEAWTNSLSDSGFACTKDSAEMSVYNRDILSVTSLNIRDKNLFPRDITLHQNYPNPFNSATVIKYQVSETNFVTLKVYDVLGSEVVTLVNEKLPSGIYDVRFEAGELPSGDYFYKLKIGSFVETKKMVLMK